MSDGPKIGAGGRKKQIHRAKSARWRTVPPRCARQDDGEREVARGECGVGATKEPARRRYKDTATTERRRTEAQNYGAVRTTTHAASPASLLPGRNSAFSRTVHSTLPDERKHIQVTQNKNRCHAYSTLLRKSAPQQVFSPESGARAASVVLRSVQERSLVAPLARDDNERRRTKTVQRSATAKTETAPSTPGPGARVLTLSGAFPIIARRLLHRPIPNQAKEPRV